MFSIKVLKQEVKILNERIKTLTRIGYTNDTYVNLEMNDIKMLINDLEDAITTLKEKYLINTN